MRFVIRYGYGTIYMTQISQRKHKRSLHYGLREGEITNKMSCRAERSEVETSRPIGIIVFSSEESIANVIEKSQPFDIIVISTEALAKRRNLNFIKKSITRDLSTSHSVKAR